MGIRKNTLKDNLFPCPNEGCVRVYQSFHRVQYHLSYGKCVLKPERKTLLDTAKVMYNMKLKSGDNTFKFGLNSRAMGVRAGASDQPLKEGWALRQTKTSKPFSEKQKDFLDEKFMSGEVSGHKLDPANVSKQMRTVRDSNGQRLFTPEEYLSSKQIKGYFSRRSKNKNKIENKDFKAAEREEALSNLRRNVIKQTLADHPIMFDGYNLCEMVASNKLSKLTLSVLKNACDHYELNVTKVIRRKAPFIDSIEEFVKTCSCFKGNTL